MRGMRPQVGFGRVPYRTQEQRQRLGELAGVKLVEWSDGQIVDPPDPDTDECHLDLVYQTLKDDESIASVAKRLGLDDAEISNENYF